LGHAAGKWGSTTFYHPIKPGSLDDLKAKLSYQIAIDYDLYGKLLPKHYVLGTVKQAIRNTKKEKK